MLKTIWSKVMALVYMWKRRLTDRPGWEVEKTTKPGRDNPQLVLKRKWFSAKTTIGRLYIDGHPNAYILEDTVRDPNNDGIMQPEEKIPGETAIPEGTYEVIISFSGKFQRNMPLLLNVPHYSGIRIHNGVDHTHTAGCLITGLDKNLEASPWHVTYGRKAYADLLELLKIMCAHEKVYIKIINERTKRSSDKSIS